jgi:molybdate transport repressor ModE-like protein
VEHIGINLARIDLVSLNLVVHCARAGSISAAARDCHLSVMAASERLRRLEAGLGKRLFNRHRRGLEATEAGVAVSRAGEDMLHTVRLMALEVSQAREEATQLKDNPGRRASKLA